MKKNFILPALLLASTTAFATPFNGYIVKLKNPQNFLADQSLTSIGTVSTVAKTSFGTFAKVELHKGLSDKALHQLESNPNVEYVEPNYIITVNKIKSSATPSDPLFTKQWGLFNTGDGIWAKKGEDINALNAWTITKGSTNVKIAVIDTGVDYNHPDLVNQIEINMAEKNGQPGVDDDANGYVDDIYGYSFAYKNGEPMDVFGHGTHCAGIIGAQHDGQGIAGVMANVKIIPVKFLNDYGSGEEMDAVMSIDYAVKRGANILSNSWGGGPKSLALEEAIKAANKAGAVFVAAAGNEYGDNDKIPSYPAGYDVPNVISVGSFTPGGAKSTFSNVGKKTVHVFAPGNDIYSTVPNGQYEKMTGTSMAAPHVAGIVGLMLSQEPNLTPEQVRERLIKSSVQTSKLKGKSASNGRVDAYRALTIK